MSALLLALLPGVTAAALVVDRRLRRRVRACTEACELATMATLVARSRAAAWRRRAQDAEFVAERLAHRVDPDAPTSALAAAWAELP